MSNQHPATKYTVFSDPGHAWLAVEIDELVRLGIVDRISPYSYQKGEIAYLEEDCDMPVFCDAKQLRGEEFSFKEVFEEETPIRCYNSFRG